MSSISKGRKGGRAVALLLLFAACAGLMVLAVGVGSVAIPARDVADILRCRLTGEPLPAHIAELTASILMKIRLPRVLLAFLCGASLSAAGAVMQSVLRNPLASGYTLGVSSGASLGAACVLLLGMRLPVFPGATLPAAGFGFGLLTVLLAMALSARFDPSLRSDTIVLTGMVISLLASAALSMVSALHKESLEALYFWQMGSFGGATMEENAILAAVLALALPCVLRFHREMDILTFGDELAGTSGFSPKRVRRALILLATLMTGTAVSFCGTIGFVDLIMPHLARKLFGARHSALLLASAMLGGAFMVLADLLARTALSPRELPVGAVTALVGAPFFLIVYFGRRRGEARR
ncbi:MAG: iron ABC transporter permease [Clostridia bacterium]|nr:iron ABC transporter permease [Clostridia bacterium]